MGLQLFTDIFDAIEKAFNAIGYDCFTWFRFATNENRIKTFSKRIKRRTKKTH